MTVFTKRAVDIYAPYDSTGNARKPVNGESQIWGTEVERAIDGAAVGRIDQVTWADLSAITGDTEGQPAQVVGPDAGTHTDPVTSTTVDNEGSYIWSTAPAGWRRVGGLPNFIVRATNTTAGTENDIQADTVPVAYPNGPYQALISVNFVATNTGAMTASFNGEPPRNVVTNTGAPIPPGYVQPGMAALFMIDENGDYRFFSYGDASAIQAAAEAARDAAEDWAIYPEDSPVPVSSGGDGSTEFSAYHWAQKAAEVVAGADVTQSGDNTFTGQNTFSLTQEGTTGDVVRIHKNSMPAAYDNTRASLVLEHKETYDRAGGGVVPNGTKIESALFVFTDEAQGQTTSSTNSSVITGQGIRSFASKENDGSTHCFTATGELRENGVDNAIGGANGYNEFGAFQALMTNVGSSNGYMSAVEVHLRDSPNQGTNDYPTRMTGVAAGIAKYNPSALESVSIHVLNEGFSGSQHLDAILRAETRGFGAWKRGIDLYDDGTWDFSTLIAMQMRVTNKIRWTDGTNHSDIYANGAGHIILDPVNGARVWLADGGSLGSPGLAMSTDSNTGILWNAADDLQLVAGGKAGFRVLNNNVQISTAGGALKTVTEGAADSAGSGFRQLRVPN